MGPLSAVTRHAAADRVVGVAFDDDRISAVEVAVGRIRGRGGPRVVASASADLPDGAVAHGAISDHELFVDSLRSLWEDAAFGTARVAFGLDPELVVLRRAEIPAVGADDLARAATYEIGDLLRYPLDQALVSTVEIDRVERDGTGTARLLTLAVHRATVAELDEVAGDAGLTPVGVELVSTALVAAAGPGRPGAGTVDAVIDVSTSATDVIVHDDGGIVFGRVIAAGLDVAETSLSDELAMELALLEGFTSGREDGGEAAPGGGGPGLATVVEGIRRTLQYFLTEVDDRQLGRVVLCGPRAGVAGLLDAVGDAFPGAEVVRYEPPGLAADGDGPTPDAAYAVAAAATGAGRQLRRFDLVPAAVRARRAARRRLVTGLALAAVLCPVLASDALDRGAALGRERERLAAAGQAVDALRVELGGYEDEQARLVEAERAVGRVDQLLAQDHGFSTLVRQVAESMPADTFLVSVRVGRAVPGEIPTGYDGPEPLGTVTFSGVAGSLDGVGRWMQEVDEVDAVGGLWLAQTALGPYNDSDRTAAVFTVDGAVTGPAVPVRTVEDGP